MAWGCIAYLIVLKIEPQKLVGRAIDLGHELLQVAHRLVVDRLHLHTPQTQGAAFATITLLAVAILMAVTSDTVPHPLLKPEPEGEQPLLACMRDVVVKAPSNRNSLHLSATAGARLRVHKALLIPNVDVRGQHLRQHHDLRRAFAPSAPAGPMLPRLPPCPSLTSGRSAHACRCAIYKRTQVGTYPSPSGRPAHGKRACWSRLSACACIIASSSFTGASKSYSFPYSLRRKGTVTCADAPERLTNRAGTRLACAPELLASKSHSW